MTLRYSIKDKLLALCACIMILMVLCQIAVCLSGFSSALGGLDFRTFYSAGHMVRSGQAVQIYDILSEKRVQDALVAPRPEALPFFNPAYALVPFILLSLLSYKVAYFVFFVLNFTMTILAAAAVQPYLRSIAGIWEGLPTFLFLCFFPVGFALREGQMSLILLLLYCTCFAASQACWWGSRVEGNWLSRHICWWHKQQAIQMWGAIELVTTDLAVRIRATCRTRHHIP